MYIAGLNGRLIKVYINTYSSSWMILYSVRCIKFNYANDWSVKRDDVLYEDLSSCYPLYCTYQQIVHLEGIKDLSIPDNPPLGACPAVGT